MNRYEIRCTESQTRKALELGAPLLEYTSIPNFAEVIEISEFRYCEIPTAEQMIGWLRSKGMKFYFNDITTLWQVVCNHKIIGQGCSENKELAAIDAALGYIIQSKK